MTGHATNVPAGPPSIVDVPYDAPLSPILTFGQAMVVCVPLAFIVSFVAVFMPVGLTWLGLVIGGTFGFACMALYEHSVVRRWRSRAAELVQQTAGQCVEAQARHVVDYAARSNGDAFVAALVQEMARSGYAGAIMRVGPAGAATVIRPIEVAFEPRDLNDAEKTKLEADQSTGQHDGSTDSTWIWLRTIRRRAYVRPLAWLGVLWIAYNVVSASLEAWNQSRFTLPLVIWLSMLAFVIYAWSSTTVGPWLAVPGGLVQRTARTFARSSDLHLFDRRKSVLCVYCTRRRAWAFAVSDGSDTGAGTGTQEQVEFLLRAWLSPLEPPTVEQLSDLT